MQIFASTLGSILSTFNEQLCAKKLQNQYVTREKVGKALLYEKFARKMLVKLTPYIYKKYHSLQKWSMEGYVTKIHSKPLIHFVYFFKSFKGKILWSEVTLSSTVFCDFCFDCYMLFLLLNKLLKPFHL